MGELIVFSPSYSFLSRKQKLHGAHVFLSRKQKLHDLRNRVASPMCFSPTNHTIFTHGYIKQEPHSWRTEAGPAGIISDSLSQDLTLGYGALIGIGGLMGYLNGGSQKSLIAGGVSTALLYYVYSILPWNPVLASSIGLGISATLMGVMGLRLLETGKLFPAGLVFFSSLIMSGGYLHGILRTLGS